ncbi:MAG: YicC family protein [Gammaproteobacteria bacterium]|nr:YicC family protein [Gammaproteobacteria bacterium]MYD76163.1 YicC family protein [Gammaproteobacteria bacterium]MYJ51344.1 YicC family protein [Gammaproteobacteria bacterium]
MTQSRIHSMTGFARGQSKTADAMYVWEIRSVNHRYLDIALKLPPAMRHLEPRIREKVHAALNRGRVDIALQAHKILSGNLDDLDRDGLDALARLMVSVRVAHPELAPGSVSDLLGWPGIFPEEPANDGTDACLASLDDTLEQLVRARREEGQRLSGIILEKLQHCQSAVFDLEADMPDIQEQVRLNWERRIREIETDIEPQRVAQEIALLLTKGDVTEELDRLKSHLDESASLLDGGGPVGRRLDFLMQELHREANTLGAKSVSTAMTGTAIDLKVLIEQAREQVQNIE